MNLHTINKTRRMSKAPASWREWQLTAQFPVEEAGPRLYYCKQSRFQACRLSKEQNRPYNRSEFRQFRKGRVVHAFERGVLHVRDRRQIGNSAHWRRSSVISGAPLVSKALGFLDKPASSAAGIPFHQKWQQHREAVEAGSRPIPGLPALGKPSSPALTTVCNAPASFVRGGFYFHPSDEDLSPGGPVRKKPLSGCAFGV
jgi:hypothetical protein